MFIAMMKDHPSSIHRTRLTVASSNFSVRRAPREICQIRSIIVVMPVLSRPLLHKLPQGFPIEERLSAHEVETSHPNKRLAKVTGPVHYLFGQLDLLATDNYTTSVIKPVVAYVELQMLHLDTDTGSPGNDSEG
jgi:hypothetical protein